MSSLTSTDLPLSGLKRIERQRVGDERGFLSRLFCADALAGTGWIKPIAQINHTYTARKGTVRGLHFQRPPHCEMKLVSVLHGEIWDVVVDLRAGSPTFLQWHAERLSVDKGRALLIPEGCAHGFQSLTEDVDLLYCHSASYQPQAEGGLNPLDPALDIAWPLAIAGISRRDESHPLIDTEFPGLRLDEV